MVLRTVGHLGLVSWDNVVFRYSYIYRDGDDLLVSGGDEVFMYFYVSVDGDDLDDEKRLCAGIIIVSVIVKWKEHLW